MLKLKTTFKFFTLASLLAFTATPLYVFGQNQPSLPPWGTNNNITINSDTIFHENMEVATQTTFNVEANHKLILNGNLNTPFRIPLNFIIKQGQGRLELNGDNSNFQATMALEAGTINVSGQSALGQFWSILTQHVGTTLSFAPNSLIHNPININPALKHSPALGSNQSGVVWHVENGTASFIGDLTHDLTNGPIANPIPLIKTGTGTLRLGGRLAGNRHRIDIHAGTLDLLESTLMPGTITALPNTALTGTGIANNIVINYGATFAPSGKFTVFNDAQLHAGSKFLVHTWNDGTSDSLHSNQTASLGGTVIALPQGNPSDWTTQPEYSYVIVNADNGLNNSKFDAIESAVPYLQAKLNYTPNKAILILSPAAVTTDTSNATTNPITSNCSFSAVAAHTILDSRLVRNAALSNNKENSFWAQGFHSSADMRNMCATGSGQKQTTGLIGGTGIKIKNNWYIGWLAGVSNTSIYASGPHGFNNKALSHHIGLHASKSTNWGNLKLGAAFSHHKIQNSRKATTPLLQHTAYSNTKAQTKQLFIHASGKHHGTTSVVPFASAAWVSYRQSKITERGGLLALQVNKHKQNSLVTTLGFNAQHNVDVKQGNALLELEAGWIHTHGKRKPNLKQHYRYDSLQTTVIDNSKALPRNLWALKLGMQAQANRNTDISINYSGLYGRGLQDHGVQLALIINW